MIHDMQKEGRFIPKSIFELLKTTIREIGFDPRLALDENGEWRVDTVDSCPTEKYVAAHVIRKDRLNAYLTNEIFSHMLEFGHRELNGFRCQNGFLHSGVIEGAAEYYLCKFIEYDKECVFREKRGKFDAIIHCDKYKRCYYRNGWKDKTRELIYDTLAKAECYIVIGHMKDYLNKVGEKNIDYNTWKQYVMDGIGESTLHELDRSIKRPLPFIITKRVSNKDRLRIYKESIDIENGKLTHLDNEEILMDIPAFSFYFDASDDDVGMLLDLPIFKHTEKKEWGIMHALA